MVSGLIYNCGESEKLYIYFFGRVATLTMLKSWRRPRLRQVEVLVECARVVYDRRSRCFVADVGRPKTPVGYRRNKQWRIDGPAQEQPNRRVAVTWTSKVFLFFGLSCHLCIPAVSYEWQYRHKLRRAEVIRFLRPITDQ
jgi:hypothetical protein